MDTKNLKKLPIGIDDFVKIRTDNFYYVDKTNLIKELMTDWNEVNLFTRPRRFGKSLNMSMLRSFFEVGCDKSLFEGLHIVGDKEICESHMGKYPVVSVSLKDVNGFTFSKAVESMKFMIGNEARRFRFLLDSDKLSEMEKNMYRALIHVENGIYSMSDVVLENSLHTLTMLLSLHYDTQVVLLIDEYDVPLDKAFHAGFYDEMISLIRNMLSKSLKSNSFLKLSVLTGCLRISKESIFTGLNNLKVFSIMDEQFDEFFGFTDSEVQELLKYYGLSDKYADVKEWYDGYLFGDVSVYCPWDVIVYVYDLRTKKNAKPQAYWMNTSSNSIVKRFIQKAPKSTKAEIEMLIEGNAVWKEVHADMTYNELDKNIGNLWSVLFMTGYLTQKEYSYEANKYLLAIPNKEIRQIFIQQVREWFSEITTQDMSVLHTFVQAFKHGNAQRIEEMFTSYLRKSISIRDTSIAKEKKENFYHGILLGLFAPMEAWYVVSNAETGEGYSDILIETDDEIGILIEVKYAENAEFDTACKKALKQIDEKRYEERLLDDGMKTIYKYGIACYKKRCKVVLEEKE